jgi:hypothetical protein
MGEHMRTHRFALTVVLALTLAAVLAAPASAATVRLRVTTSAFSFGSVAVGQESTPRAVYYTNRSAVPVRWTGSVFQYRPTFDSFDVTDGAQLTAGCWNGTEFLLAPGQTCAINVVTFAPTSTGTHYIDIGSRFSDGASFVDVWVTEKGKGV